jgi:Domain of unknown function (DUF6438)
MHYYILTFCILLFSCKTKKEAPLAGSNEPLIELTTHGCRGWCPVYKLIFRQNGTVDYEGIRSVTVIGAAKITLSKSEYEALQKKVKETDLWQYPDLIESDVADAPSATMTVYRGSESKSVSGTMDRPKPLLVLEAFMQNLAEKHDIPVKKGVDPNAAPHASRAEIILKLDKTIDAGTWIEQFEDLNLRLVKRISPDNNLWRVSYDPKEINETALIDLFKKTAGALEAQPNKAVEERH